MYTNITSKWKHPKETIILKLRKSSFSKYGNSLVFRMEKNLSEPYLDCFMLNPNGKDHVSLILPVHGAQTDLSITTSEIYTI